MFELKTAPVDVLLREASKRFDELLKLTACTALRQAQHYIDCAIQVLEDNARKVAESAAAAQEGR